MWMLPSARTSVRTTLPQALNQPSCAITFASWNTAFSTRAKCWRWQRVSLVRPAFLNYRAATFKVWIKRKKPFHVSSRLMFRGRASPTQSSVTWTVTIKVTTTTSEPNLRKLCVRTFYVAIATAGGRWGLSEQDIHELEHFSGLSDDVRCNQERICGYCSFLRHWDTTTISMWLSRQPFRMTISRETILKPRMITDHGVLPVIPTAGRLVNRVHSKKTQNPALSVNHFRWSALRIESLPATSSIPKPLWQK